MSNMKQYIPKKSPVHYLTGITALNIPSEEGTGDWHFVNTLLGANGKPPKTFFIAGLNYPSSSKWLENESLYDCAKILKRYKIPIVDAQIWASNHYRALIDMIIYYINKNADLMMNIQLDDWLPEEEEKNKLYKLLKKVHSLNGFNDDEWQILDHFNWPLTTSWMVRQ